MCIVVTFMCTNKTHCLIMTLSMRMTALKQQGPKRGACPWVYYDKLVGCVQVKAMLGGPKGKEAVALSDDETIEKCLNEVEAALNAGLNFKGKFNSGLQVRSSSSPSLHVC